MRLVNAAQQQPETAQETGTIPGPARKPDELCQFCFGSGMEMMPRYSDLTTQEQRGGARRCRCRVEADRAEARRQALAVIPREFGVPRLHLIAPDAKRYAQQFAKLEMLRSDPDRSYLICGRNGTGKSFFGWALYVHAIEQGRRAAACTLYELLKEYRRYTCQPAQNDWRPRVLPEDLKQNDTRWTIFLDEIHAATPSEFATREFFYLLKAATEYGHQMIYTCNVKPEVLHQRWSSVNEFEGDSIARRLAEYSKRIEMF